MKLNEIHEFPEALWKIFQMGPTTFFYPYKLKRYSLTNWNGSNNSKFNFYCTFQDPCSTISQWHWAKFMSFWKLFKWSFKWDQPQISIFICLKDIAWQSGMGQTTLKSIFTVLWEITVVSFLKEIEQNLWASKSF